MGGRAYDNGNSIGNIMTRINVVSVETLTREHLIAEYRELPRVFKLAFNAGLSSKNWSLRQPPYYTMGTGHVLFFYDKLKFLADRQKQIILEMLKRGYNPSNRTCLELQWRGATPDWMWKDYEPTMEALRINQERINKRLSGDKS